LLVLWAALLGRPIIARCHFDGCVVISKNNKNVLVVGNFSQGIGAPLGWNEVALPPGWVEP